MKATIIYDNPAFEGFQSVWSFSYLVTQRMLFDTGDYFVSVEAGRILEI